MAIQFNPNALRMFSDVNFGDDNAIANLGGENNLVQKDKLGSSLLKPFRSSETDQVKNYVRERLETLVKTTVDRCLETTKLDDCVETIDALYRHYYRVEEALLALEK